MANEPEVKPGSEGTPPESKPPVETPPAAHWTDGIAADIKDSEGGKTFLGKFKSGDDQVRAHIALEKQMGGRIAVPRDDAKPEEWASFYSKIGRPEKIEDYGPHAVPEGLPWNKESESRMRQVFYDQGLTKRQVQKVLEAYTQEQANEYRGAEASWAKTQEAAWATLRERWGADTDNRVALIQRSIELRGGPGLVAALEKSGMGNDPHWLEYAWGFAQSMVEDNILKPDLAVKSNQGLQEELDSLMNGKAYWTKDDPGHDAAVQRVAAINKMLYPSPV